MAWYDEKDQEREDEISSMYAPLSEKEKQMIDIKHAEMLKPFSHLPQDKHGDYIIWDDPQLTVGILCDGYWVQGDAYGFIKDAIYPYITAAAKAGKFNITPSIEVAIGAAKAQEREFKLKDEIYLKQLNKLMMKIKLNKYPIIPIYRSRGDIIYMVRDTARIDDACHDRVNTKPNRKTIMGYVVWSRNIEDAKHKVERKNWDVKDILYEFIGGTIYGFHPTWDTQWVKDLVTLYESQVKR